jgi:hypothetical protein
MNDYTTLHIRAQAQRLAELLKLDKTEMEVLFDELHDAFLFGIKHEIQQLQEGK